MTFIEYLTWNTTVFSLYVIELEYLFSTFFFGARGGYIIIFLHHYSYAQQQCYSINTKMTICNNQKKKAREDFWIFYDWRKGMSYHAKHTVGQTTMCFFLSFFFFNFFPYWIKNVFLSKWIRQKNVESMQHLISIQHKNSHLKHILKIHTTELSR